ncbi:hypothetical protein EWM64_g663 [Hericium alpestre]|uniref:Protein S-acyltransferase n=1 Tax=Hericium alpestre TaxID=135208 RepID=A0A4Z0A8E8_9AGAM|nr:hypothetical protein EWM64_g663 [Hericium alpestre]
MVTKRVLHAMRSPYYDAPGGAELVFIVLNYVTCIPVLLMVGGFSLYHFYCLLGNSTTIEGWEKQKVATLVRRGKIRQVKFPYNIGRRRNVESMLGKNPLLWCWPTIPPGTGLKYQLAEGEDARRRSASQRRQAGIAAAPPWHPDHEAEETAFDHDSLASSDEEGDIRDGASGPRIRRGSEGYEVQAVDREEILRRYIESRGEEAGRYNRYVPEPPSESETDEEEPLAKRVDKWRAGEAVA